MQAARQAAHSTPPHRKDVAPKDISTVADAITTIIITTITGTVKRATCAGR